MMKTKLRGEFTIPGEKGTTLRCWKCLRAYDNCSMREACFCACDPSGPTQLVTDRDIYSVNKATYAFFIQNGLFI